RSVCKDDFALAFQSNPAIIRNGAQKGGVSNDRKQIFSFGVTAKNEVWFYDDRHARPNDCAQRIPRSRSKMRGIVSQLRQSAADTVVGKVRFRRQSTAEWILWIRLRRIIR